MINCSNCGFSVSQNMKFALIQNTCPSCGSSLFSAKDNSLISAIQNKVVSQQFASDLKEEAIYDVALFIFNEFKRGIGQQIIQDMMKSGQEKASKASLEKEDVETEAEIRRQVEEEFASQISEINNQGLSQDKDIAQKADRLKRLREQHIARSGNKKRFSGISRKN